MGISLLRERPKGFPIALWKPSVRSRFGDLRHLADLFGESVPQTDGAVIDGEGGGGIRILAEITGAQELEGGAGFRIGDDLFGKAAADNEAFGIQAGNEILFVGFRLLVIEIIIEEGLVKTGLEGDAVPGGNPVQGFALDFPVGPSRSRRSGQCRRP